MLKNILFVSIIYSIFKIDNLSIDLKKTYRNLTKL